MLLVCVEHHSTHRLQLTLGSRFSHTFHTCVCWQEFFEEVWVYLTTLPVDNFQQEERWQQDMVRMQVRELCGRVWGSWGEDGYEGGWVGTAHGLAAGHGAHAGERDVWEGVGKLGRCWVCRAVLGLAAGQIAYAGEGTSPGTRCHLGPRNRHPTSLLHNRRCTPTRRMVLAVCTCHMCGTAWDPRCPPGS